MPGEDLINTTVDEYLISLANSINHAQRHISSLYIAGRTGEPTITYQLPRVDFELKLLFQLSTTHPPSGARQRDVARSEGGAWLEAHPAGVGAGAPDSGVAQAASTIKGSFVAVPVHGGTPPPVITTSWQSLPGNTYEIRVSVRSSLGEAMRGQEVQFNVDKDLARLLNPVLSAEQDLRKILPQTHVEPGVGTTASDGDASALLVVGDAGLRVPVVIDVLGTTRTLVFGGDSAPPAA